jgi:hypothetical protein
MAKLIGNYSLPGQDDAPEEEKDESKADKTVSEFERRAMERLGGSIAFVMKGKNAVWNGGEPS